MNLLMFMSAKKDHEAKFWLNPVTAVCEGRYRKNELRDIERIISSNLEFPLSAWEKEKSKHVNG